MNIYDVSVFSVCTLVILALGISVGCAPQDTTDVSYMPYMELDYTPARTTPTRSSINTTTASRYTGDRDWAAEGNRPWKYIVIHHSATDRGNAAEFHKMHLKNGWDELGYHFVIDNGDGGQDGLVEVGPRWRKQKWGAHTGGTPNNEYNNFGIGVCLVGNFMSKNPTPNQMNSMRKLVEYLMSQYDIPASRVIAHQQAPNANTQCCGRVLINYLDSTLRPEFAQAMR